MLPPKKRWYSIVSVFSLVCYESLEDWGFARVVSLRFWVEGVAVTAVGCFGLVGNAVTWIVLRQV